MWNFSCCLKVILIRLFCVLALATWTFLQKKLLLPIYLSFLVILTMQLLWSFVKATFNSKFCAMFSFCHFSMHGYLSNMVSHFKVFSINTSCFLSESTSWRLSEYLDKKRWFMILLIDWAIVINTFAINICSYMEACAEYFPELFVKC